MATAATVAVVCACWLLGSVASVLIRRRMGRARWQRLFHPDPGRNRIVWPEQWKGAVARAWRSRRASWWVPLLGGGLGVAVGYAAAGSVAATVFGAYGAAGVAVLRRRAQHRSRVRAHQAASDAVAALAADLRAGMAHEQALLAAESLMRQAGEMLLPAPSGPMPARRRLASAIAVSRASGAPLADLLERLDAHLRAVDRTRALAETQAAGARASAALLAAMPVAGLALGAAIGVDPVRVLLHTAPGSVALCSAVALQLGGLAWTARLARVEVAI
jgi:tight adherence protein B